MASNEMFYFDGLVDFNTINKSVEGPIPIPDVNDIKYNSLVGFLFKLNAQLQINPIPIGGRIPSAIPIKYNLTFRKVLLSHLKSPNTFFDDTNNPEIVIFRINEIQTLSNSSITGGRKLYTLPIKWPSINPNHSIIRPTSLSDISFEFLPDCIVDGNNELKTVDFFFLSKDSLRYLLNPVFNGETRTIRITGAKITMGYTFQSITEPENADGGGYFTLKFELVDPALYRTTGSTAGSTASLPDPSVLLAAPCPPLWIPPSISPLVGDSPSEIIKYYNLFDKFKARFSVKE